MSPQVEEERREAAQPWHTLDAAEVLARMASSTLGLSTEEARRRLAAHGPNELDRPEGASAWRTLAAQFTNVLVLILLAAAVVSAALGEALEAGVIALIVVFAAVLGFVQEYRAERSLEALRELATPSARVRREGRERTVPAREVVPGDLILLSAGDRVPADARVIEVRTLAVDESALTGESIPVRKSPDALGDAALAIGDRRNMVYMGTLVVQGRGEAVVVATGGRTELGAISRMVQEVRPARTPLQVDLERIGRALGRAALAVVGVIAAIGVWRGDPLFDVFMFGIALAVAVVPEALPAVVTISLAIGVRRMARRHALVRRLPVVETLGATSVICSDKTGTLTRNEMMVRELYVGERIIEISGAGYVPDGEFLENGTPIDLDDDLRDLLIAGALCSDARLERADGRWRVDGDPTEGALLVAAVKAGMDLDALRKRWPRIDEIPFSSERRRMTTIHGSAGDALVCSKGAADVILSTCEARRVGGRDEPLDDAARQRIFEVERQMAERGLRVLAIAHRRGGDHSERRLIFLGLAGMIDPPRPEVRGAVARCESAGITPVIVTGDHPATTRSIAQELGMLKGRVITGVELQRMSDDQLAAEAPDISVYARTSPADKLRVVSAWQQRGAVVAVTGDGVNDAPALKKADVGVAMGITGTDVSKEAAGMILLDDNFATIVAAVEEGRIVFSNIRKYLGYLLSSNVGEIVLMAAAVAVGLPMPLTAVQILYVNLATDGLPAMALATDPPEADVMARAPRDPRRGVFTPDLVALIVIGGLWTGLANLALFAWQLRAGRPVQEAMAIVFVALVLTEFCKAYSYRSLRLSILNDIFGNRWLNAAVLWELLLLSAVINIGWLQRAFGTAGIGSRDWLTALAVAITIVPVLEVVKRVQGRNDETGALRERKTHAI
jgi:Ca2+-transporting ATPase